MSAWSLESFEPQIPSHLNHPVLSVAIQAAQRAGAIVASYFQSKVEMRHKGGSELVSNADLEAEKAIADCIRDAFPTHAIMAEETMQVAQECEDLWIIDPLDGTNNFAHQIPHFAVSIGYMRRGLGECGVIVNPITKDWYVTVRGQGAWYAGLRCQVCADQKLDETMIALGFYYDRGAMMEATLDAIKDFFRQNIHGVRRFGAAALDLGMLGRGMFGAFFEFQLSPWDFAAGRLFVEESGGKVSSCNGGTLPYNRKSSLLASNGTLHQAALDIVRPHWDSYVARSEAKHV